MPKQLYFNGVDADTGVCAFPPVSSEDLVQLASADISGVNPALLGELTRRKNKLTKPDYAPIEGKDPKDLGDCGWGIIFPHDGTKENALRVEAIKDALKPLLDLRRSQATKKADRYRECSGEKGFWSPIDTKPDFLDRHGAGGGGAVDPDQLPYYLLIVGSPDEIPFTFQYQLDVQYAVGRLYFENHNLDDYARYAASVVEAESGRVMRAKRAAFFGVSNTDDMATMLSATELVAPLAKLMETDQPSWKVDTIAPQDAMKKRLARLMGGDDTPALLFTASHGMLFRSDNPNQATGMGALLCGDWGGESAKGPVSPEWYFGGDDLAPDASLLGMIAFNFACFGAATPALDDYTEEGETKAKVLASRSFVAHLPQRMLAHPKGGALACIGHVDRAWGYSFKSENGDAQLRVFKSALKRLMEGHPVGSALEYFNNRYAELSSDLSTTVRSMKFRAVDPDALTYQWTCNNDAKNYVIIGDPAVRLPVADSPVEIKNSTIAAIATKPKPKAAVDYGIQTLFGPPETAPHAKLQFQDLAATLVAKLSAAIDSVATVQVKTYSTAELKDGPAGSDPFAGASLRAISEIRLDGNARICVPEKDGKIDDALWKLHSDMVERALANRIEMFKLAAAAASSLVSGIKLF